MACVESVKVVVKVEGNIQQRTKNGTKNFWCKKLCGEHDIVSRKSVLVTLMKYSKDSKLGAFNV